MKQLLAALTLIIGIGISGCGDNAPSQTDHVDSARVNQEETGTNNNMGDTPAGGNSSDTTRRNASDSPTGSNRSDTARRND